MDTLKLTDEAREKRAEYMRKYRANMTPEQRANINAYARKWRHNNPDRVKTYNTNYWNKRAQDGQQNAQEKEPITAGIYKPTAADFGF